MEGVFLLKNIDSFEIFLYVFPIIEIILLTFFFKPYLQYKKFKLAVSDATLPILLLGIHFLSVRLLTYSLLPHFLLATFFVGLLLTLYFDFSKRNLTTAKLFSIFLKAAFVLGFLTYYGIVVARIFQILHG